MNTVKPKYVAGFTTLFWGWQTDLLYFAIPMAIIIEARHFLNRRWALTKTDFYRIADLTNVGLAGMLLFLFLNRTEYHFIVSLLSWIPILLFPLVVVLSYSTTPRMSLDVLFPSLRRQKEPVQQSWDMDYVFLATCLLSAGLNRDGSYYFPIAALIIALTLYPLRSPRFPNSVFVLAMSIIFLGATAVHYGLRGAHMEIKEKTELWIANWIAQRTDPLRTRTGLGQVGRLKLSDSIAFRIEPLSGKRDFPLLLREASYDTMSGTNWEVFDPRFHEVPHADDFTWTFADNTHQYPQAKIYLEFDRERDLIPAPAELVELHELPATDVSMSIYGAIQGDGLIPAPYYRVRYDVEPHISNRPSSTDMVVPRKYQSIIAQVVPENLEQEDVRQDNSQQDSQQGSQQDKAAIQFVQNYFSDFSYSLFQSDFDPEQNPLSRFLLDTRAGHCEHFATATVLMLRQLGIPARYVVGYSVQEWNERLGMYVVRKRHAHAWATAYVNGRWVVVDTTPSRWLGLENDNAGALQPIWDYLGNSQFLFQNWWNDQRIEDYETELYVLGFILVLVLIWRISTSEQVILESGKDAQISEYLVPGRESPFFDVEQRLTLSGYRRGPGELMRDWLVRIDRPELLPLLINHNRWRFDPHGISIEAKRELASQVSEWLQQNENATSE